MKTIAISETPYRLCPGGGTDLIPYVRAALARGSIGRPGHRVLYGCGQQDYFFRIAGYCRSAETAESGGVLHQYH